MIAICTLLDEFLITPLDRTGGVKPNLLVSWHKLCCEMAFCSYEAIVACAGAVHDDFTY